MDDFQNSASPWHTQKQLLIRVLEDNLKAVVQWMKEHLGSDQSNWQWQNIHAVSFGHSLQKHEPWSHIKFGPDPVGGTPTTLGMAKHLGKGPFDVFHGPVLRMVVDLADPDHTRFVMAGGNSGRHDSPHSMDQYALWLSGDYVTVRHQKSSLGRSAKIRWHITS